MNITASGIGFVDVFRPNRPVPHVWFPEAGKGLVFFPFSFCRQGMVVTTSRVEEVRNFGRWFRTAMEAAH